MPDKTSPSVLTGTSGYSYKAWKGHFYPDDLADRDMLGYYSEHLKTVEINNTFYRMPKAEVVDRWLEVTPPSFRFVLKATRRVTHSAKLRPDDDVLEYLFGITGRLGDRLAAHLFQMPPWARKDLEALREFLGRLPAGDRAAFEFRHDSWFDDEVYDVLRAADAALVLADGGKVEVPFVPTASWGYLRLRRDDYDDAALETWAERIAATGWQTALVFFKHEDAGAGPRMAATMARLCGTD